jgi:hypothetical protein
VPAPYRTPKSGQPLRLAFVGQSTYFEACALDGERPDVDTRFHEFRMGGDIEGLRSELDDFQPHVVAVFRPEIIPAGAFAGLNAATLGFLTEPILRQVGGGHPDLERRLWELSQVDATQFDRTVAFDPLIVDTAKEVLPVWRAVALPVADRYYADVEPMTQDPRILFVGRSTDHRERMLGKAKAELPELLHVAFGIGAQDLEDLMRDHDVGINLHNQSYISFENRVCLHLAAGHLVISEPLSPTHGLEHGLDYVHVGTPDGLAHVLDQVRRYPRMWHAVRVRGRAKAELFRASKVWPRLVRDLLDDLSAFGTHRTS